MKRTRRVEIVTYSRRVTVSEATSVAPYPVVDQIADVVILDALAIVPPTRQRMTVEKSASDATAVVQPPRRRFRDLFRLRQ